MKKRITENANIRNNKINDNLNTKYLSDKLYMEDSATSLYNKNYFNRNMQALVLQMIKGLMENSKNNNNKTTWSIMFCDIDGLKLANDTLGHIEADEGIKMIADIIRSCIRTNREQNDQIVYPNKDNNKIKHNIPIRFGGDEFIIILPNCTKDKALLIEQRIKTLISYNMEHTKNMTLSIGIADTSEIKIPEQVNDSANLITFMNQLVTLAENRMYEDKNKDIRNLSYEDKKAIMIKHLARIGDNIGFNINSTEDIDLLIHILNDIKDDKTKKR